MPLVAGARLGPYEIIAPIGSGGMGVVYRARDTRLGRDVAIKISSEHFTERFEREARAIAALNHPNICQLFDVGPDYLVMELIEGTPLRGPMPVDQALACARQIADALDTAHEKGIVHRDLKPSNILITAEGAVKLLDFGLAKTAELSASDPQNSPTMTISPTRAGMILGTAAYMAPEQARGAAVDKRVDIWAFGCVLFEILTGRQAFRGDTVSDLLAAVLKEQPDLSEIPAQLRRIIEKCLRKDARARWRDIGDVKMALEDAAIAAPAASPSRSRWQALPWILAGLLAVALGLAFLWLPSRTQERLPIRLPVDLGPDAALRGTFNTFAISPDGSRLVFAIKSVDGTNRLAVRPLDQGGAIPLQGTEGARDPFFSPDGQWIAFAAGGKLKKVPVQGGVPSVLCDAPNFRGGSWSENGFIIAALNTQGPLMRVPDAGGNPEPATHLGTSPPEISHRWPQVLPGGDMVVYTAAKLPNFQDASVVVQSLKSGKRAELWNGGTFGRYVASGYLLFHHSGTLFAAAMDASKMRLTGAPAPVLEGVEANIVTGAAFIDCSRNGEFVFAAGEAVQSHSLYWRTPDSEPQLVASYPGAFALQLAPDGHRVALSVADKANSDVWVYDLDRGSRLRLTFDGTSSNQVWTRDGKYVAYLSQRPAGHELNAVRADGSGAKLTLYSSNSSGLQPGDFSPDGKYFVFSVLAPVTTGDIMVIPVDHGFSGELKAGAAQPLVASPANELDPTISPDGRWLAYSSDETGRSEVYVRPFPGSGGRWQVSTDGGALPIWSRAGRELFFNIGSRLMVVSYSSQGGSFISDKPRLWTRQEFPNPSFYRMFDAAADGKRMLELRPSNPAGQERTATQLTFVLNFFEELRRRLPK